MRIGVATVSHETNTFASGKTTLKDFETAIGEQLLKSFSEGRSLEGIVETLRKEECTVIPMVGAGSIPGPTVDRDAFEWIKATLREQLAEVSLEGVCLDLHGSMFVEGSPDAEGELLEVIREEVGPDVTITAALDMHATITERMIDHLDGVAGYRTAPHTDVIETGRRAAELLIADRQDEIDLALAWKRLPMLLAGEQSETEAEPMHSLIETLRATDQKESVYDTNYFLGFPWADSPYAGCHAVVTGDRGAKGNVRATTRKLAEDFWSARESFDFTTEAYTPTATLEIAASESDRPVVIAETGDIPGAGASENVVDFLKTILSATGLGPTAVALYADADSYEQCRAAGRGAELNIKLGAFFDREESMELTGTVESFADIDGTNVVAFEVDDTVIFIADKRSNVHRDPKFLSALEYDIQNFETIVLKSGYLSPAWKSVAARRLFALTAGDTNQTLENLPYENVPRPIYPLDPTATIDGNVRWSI